MKMHSFLRYRISTAFVVMLALGFGSVAHAQIFFMSPTGDQEAKIDASDKKVTVVGPDGKEISLGGGGSCGTLCAVLTAKIENGKAFFAPAVPGVDMGLATAPFKAVFAETFNAKEYEMVMATPELATAAVGKMVGIVSADGANAKIGLVDTKDQRVDVLIAEMNQAKTDIANLKAELALVRKELAMKVKEETACRSENIPVIIEKAVGSGDWVVTPQAAPAPIRLPIIKQAAPLIQV